MPSQDEHVAELEQLRARVRELEQEVERLGEQHAQDRRAFELMDTIVNHSPLVMYVKDASYTYLLVNREYERLSGRPREQTLGKNDFDIFERPVAQLFREQDEEVVERGCPVEFRETIPLPDGIHTFITSKFPLRAASGELRGVAGLCTEITELERARERLEQAQSELVKQARLAMLGELAASVAHEVRNPLGVVFNAVAALKRLPPCAEGHGRELLEIVEVEAGRLNRMVGSLLELSRPPQVSLEPADVAKLAASAIDAARTLAADPQARVNLELPRPLPEVCLDEHLLRQALSNLVCNALQAPGRRGPVTVRIAHEAGAALRFEVIDDGAGVPADLVERVFAPFFTTRATGTGLGLTVVRRVAEAHRGTVSLRPTPGGGATFVLEIPLGSPSSQLPGKP